MLTRSEEKTLREKIASLSSGKYYDEIYHWFDLLDQVIQNWRFGDVYLVVLVQNAFKQMGNSLLLDIRR